MNSNPIISTVESCEITSIIEDNAVASLKAWSPWSEITFDHQSDHLRTSCTAAFPFFNTISAMDFSGREHERVAQCMEWVKQRNTPMSWWLGAKSNTPTLNEAIFNTGCFKTGDNTALAMNLNELRWDGVLPTGLEVIEVESPEEMRLWEETMVPPHQIPNPIIKPWTEMYLAAGYGLSSKGWRHFIAYLNSKPVGATSSFTGAGVATIANVAVHEHYQQQGIGRAISAWTLALTREQGYRRQRICHGGLSV